MDERSLAQARERRGSRELRGLELAEERFLEIRPVAHGVWSVPSCSGEDVYLVGLRDESCTCPDYRRRSLPCKHVYAATAVRAKSAGCVGCGVRSRRREMVEVSVDSLTFFEGDPLCKSCARKHGEL